MRVKYPQVNIGAIDLNGPEGNAFYIIGRTVKGLKDAGVPEEEIESYRDKAMSGDYANVLETTSRTVSVEFLEG